jgi:hypothetical protein
VGGQPVSFTKEQNCGLSRLKKAYHDMIAVV